ncbi:DUF971 domain-containing protein [Aquisphaera insulae]|uniref:DUF971 domain-containing protein n=1 Tax=Aquisphaera insulae TaxID=2712864 RepID=UPI0013ED634B|nr:DUF971 domain-containing protein [Aquisphaera insulae]
MIDPPSNIRALQGEQILEIHWHDGRVDRLPYVFLRSECPCASCRHEWTGERLIDPASIRPDLALEAMSPVGNYAVQLAWNDGHSSGLFTWESLREIGGRGPE